MTENDIVSRIRADYADAVTEGCCLCATSAYDEMDLSHIPEEVKNANQGCSSPLSDAMCGLAEGMTVVDLGCGAGLDVFIAARYVGHTGRAVGIDMTPEMLAIAKRNSPVVAADLGYTNTDFFESRIEALPLDADTADIVISNCVINLSQEKEKVFAEIFRVLKPGGYFIISDVYANQPIPEALKTDPKLISMCIGGAMELREFSEMAEAAGFTNVSALHADAYTELGGYEFVSATYSGDKANESTDK
jgi:SAM-dependent methyltransferase